MVVAYDGTDFSRLRGAAEPAHVRTVGGVLGQAIAQGAAPRRRAHVRGAHRRRRARVGSGRVVPGAARARSVAAAVGGQRRCSGPRSSCGRASSSTRGSTRGTRRGGGSTATRSSTGRCPTRSATGSRGGCPSRSTCARCGSPPTRSSVSTTSRRSAARAARDRRRCAACSSRRGSTKATACCATRSARSRSAGRWCARSSARSSRSASASAGPGDMLGLIARARSRGRGPARAAARPLPLGRRLLTRTGVARAASSSVRHASSRTSAGFVAGELGVVRELGQRHGRLEVGSRRLGRPRSRSGCRSAS